MVARSFSGVWRRETTLFIEPLCVFCIVLISEFDNEKKATSDPEIRPEKTRRVIKINNWNNIVTISGPIKVLDIWINNSGSGKSISNFCI